ncbi:hypothetical protein KKE74_01475 [Patescibacteria group bacterium]|nr:hypothetical protein [Patescibacteria group bacterium]MBU2472683.1 hypothetical protein [Patescibacteria group bacterium]
MRKKNNHGKLKCNECKKTIHLKDGKPLHKKKSIECPSCGHSNTVKRKGNGKIMLI